MDKLNIKSLKVIYDSLTYDDQISFNKNIKKEINILNNFNALIDYCLTIYYVDHFIYKNKKYYEFKNTVSNNEEKKNFDDTIMCMGENCCFLNCLYPDCCCDENTQCDFNEDDILVKPDANDKIEYILSLYVNPQNLRGYDPLYFDYLYENRNQILLYAEENFERKKTIVIHYSNENNENNLSYDEDHELINHCILVVPIINHVELQLPCTLEKFAEALFIIKRSKWSSDFEDFSFASECYNIIEGFDEEVRYLDIRFEKNEYVFW